ncbi:transglutaminase family protein [Candidatus Poribacteria bacterium]|nr:transglutaminase family protein [Candidatus Poribacteria bacterium]
MKYRIAHTTVYDYEDPVSVSHNKAHLRPRKTACQDVQSAELHVDPKPTVCVEHLDYFGNNTSLFTIQMPHTHLRVHLESIVEVSVPPIAKPEFTVSCDAARAMMRGDLSVAGLEALEFAFASPLVPMLDRIREYARPSFDPGRPLLEACLGLMARIREDFTYQPQTTTVSTPIREVFLSRRGVCQDFAHLMIGCVRSMGLSARYVSGYLLTRAPEGKPRLAGADASHAWLSVCHPGSGWIDFDPTNNMIPADQHITLAWGRDYGDVSPLRGVILGGGRQSLAVAVDVQHG